MAALDPGDQTRIDNLIIAHDGAKAAMLQIIADNGAGVDQSAATVDVLTLTDSLSTFSNDLTVDGNILGKSGLITCEKAGVSEAGFSAKTNNTVRWRIVAPVASVDCVVLDGSSIERFRINTATGVITPSGGIQLGGTAAANLQDDYEEGTFTPDVSFLTTTDTIVYATQTGDYTKVGRLVTCKLRVGTSDIGTSTGAIVIGGLPFTNSSSTFGACAIGFTRGLGITAGEGVCGYVRLGETNIRLEVYDSGAGSTAMDSAEWSDNGDVTMTVQYSV